MFMNNELVKHEHHSISNPPNMKLFLRQHSQLVFIVSTWLEHIRFHLHTNEVCHILV